MARWRDYRRLRLSCTTNVFRTDVYTVGLGQTITPGGSASLSRDILNNKNSLAVIKINLFTFLAVKLWRQVACDKPFGPSDATAACITTCSVTSEYNPVCGTDNVTYTNPGRFECARNCGLSKFEFLESSS